MELFDIKIKGVTDDTRDVKEGYVFVAIKGGNFDGHNKAKEMLKEKGAAAVIVERDLGLERQIIVPDTRKAFCEYASQFYNYPTRHLKLIGVTGTNGKTTTSTLIQFMLKTLGHNKNTGFIGTTHYDVCDKNDKIYESHLSTPRQEKLYSLFSEMVNNNAEYCVMEASSQALDQRRIQGEEFEIGVFTNLTQDHLDWHKTMDNYFSAKKKLFKSTKSAVICIDDEYGKRLYGEVKALGIPVLSYGMSDDADFNASSIKATSSSVSYFLSVGSEKKAFPVSFNMPGVFNVSNSMAAIAALSLLGFRVGDCVEAISKTNGVRGRCEVIFSGDFTVICDYAHTEDALKKILTCVGEFAKKRIICLFGAAGERDSDKRPSMGETVSKYADVMIITSDNPRFESPDKIINEVITGIPKNSPPCHSFVDRRAAIRFALSEAEKGDIVLLCGKGHETYQVIGDDYLPFDEREIVKEFVGGGS